MNDNQAEDYHDWGKPPRSPKGLSFVIWYVLILGALCAVLGYTFL